MKKILISLLLPAVLATFLGFTTEPTRFKESNCEYEILPGNQIAVTAFVTATGETSMTSVTVILQEKVEDEKWEDRETMTGTSYNDPKCAVSETWKVTPGAFYRFVVSFDITAPDFMGNQTRFTPEIEIPS